MQNQAHAVWFEDEFSLPVDTGSDSGATYQIQRLIVSRSGSNTINTEKGEDVIPGSSPSTKTISTSPIFLTRSKQYLGTLARIDDCYLIFNPRSDADRGRQPLAIAMPPGESSSLQECCGITD